MGISIGQSLLGVTYEFPQEPPVVIKDENQKIWLNKTKLKKMVIRGRFIFLFK